MPFFSPTQNKIGHTQLRVDQAPIVLHLRSAAAHAVFAALDRTNLHPNLTNKDLSPIRWRARLTTSTSKASSHVDVLCDNGAHSEFLAADIAHSLGAPLSPLTRVTSVRLPDGSLLPVSHKCTVTVAIDRQYKADVTFRIFPLKGISAILGMPWLHRHGIVVNHTDKSAKFEHRGCSERRLTKLGYSELLLALQSDCPPWLEC